jgi:long-chain acyl-CoA synthetase
MTPTLPIKRFEAPTIPALLTVTARRRPNAPFLRFIEPKAPDGPTRTITFAEFGRLVARGIAFLGAAGVGAGDRVLLLADNSPEWQALAIAAQHLRAEAAALFASLGTEPASDIARRVRPRVVYASTAAQWEKLRGAAPELAAAGLAAVLSDEPIDPDAVPAGVALHRIAATFGEGAPEHAPDERERLGAAVGAEDPFLLLFTSGTTGRPKGVRLPQRAMVHAIEGGNLAVGVSPDDVGLHFLPFAHIAGHAQFYLALAQGHALVMTGRREDLERGMALGPTYLFSVPLVYDRIRTAVEAKLAALPRPLRSLAQAALAAAARVRVDGHGGARDRVLTRVADRLVGRAVRAKLGGNVRGVYSGGAPAAPVLFRFFEAIGIPFVELYGMSETAGLISSNLRHGVRREGSAGLLTPDHEFRFAPDGELLVRGPLLLSGYLEAEDTADAYTDDGYFRTGDVGRLDAEGILRIEGRKKHLLVLSTGKKLSPEPIEQAIASTAAIQGAVLLGEGRPFVAAAVFVAREELARLAALGKDAAEELLPSVRAALHAFSEYEKPKRLLVVPGAPSDHPSLVTPTLKLKREALIAWLGASVARLYEPA